MAVHDEAGGLLRSKRSNVTVRDVNNSLAGGQECRLLTVRSVGLVCWRCSAAVEAASLSECLNTDETSAKIVRSSELS